MWIYQPGHKSVCQLLSHLVTGKGVCSGSGDGRTEICHKFIDLLIGSKQSSSQVGWVELASSACLTWDLEPPFFASQSSSELLKEDKVLPLEGWLVGGCTPSQSQFFQVHWKRRLNRTHSLGISWDKLKGVWSLELEVQVAGLPSPSWWVSLWKQSKRYLIAVVLCIKKC